MGVNQNVMSHSFLNLISLQKSFKSNVSCKMKIVTSHRGGGGAQGGGVSKIGLKSVTFYLNESDFVCIDVFSATSFDDKSDERLLVWKSLGTANRPSCQKDCGWSRDPG